MSAVTIVNHPDGELHIEERTNNRRRLTIKCFDENVYVPLQSCETSYPIELIKLALEVQGLAWLCDAITRDEDPAVVRAELETNLFEFLDHEAFVGKRLLDFGCGAGASTMCLARLLPQTEIVGVELNGKLIQLAQARARHYGFENLEFKISPEGAELPEGLGEFDFCMISAVYEHLLPKERLAILPKIWSSLKPGGVVFINQTPHRYYPIETHSTGLPLINYLPDRLAFFLARKWSRMRPMPNATEDELLRGGIRGATEFEIMRVIENGSEFPPILLEPHLGGHEDRLDLWHSRLNPHRWRKAKLLLKGGLKIIKAISGHVIVPYLTIAIQKDTRKARSV
jgi:2-polyprenyl-3-methyl-5-hydroxy-6-metoxy-1,4-benzoquinol methylase